ncbi:hypothetical protein HUG17_0587 [Dermatophagoides farinae]|uniref:ASX DEUBAD domain-containing protein n=1 Tax=Dermatophagoides farinae TaxID=6954 RepID=A0A9D4P7B9_DERFA|nr:hypothetical protein HUG17_0587 [Dermatophagoides farinae]
MARRKSTAKIADNDNNNNSGQQQQSTINKTTMAKQKSVKQAKNSKTSKGTKGRPKGKTKQQQQTTSAKRGRKPGKKSTTNETKSLKTTKKRKKTTTKRVIQKPGISRRHYHSVSMKLQPSKEFIQQKITKLKDQMQLIRNSQKNPDLARKMIMALERHCDKVVDRVRIKRKSRHKMSKMAKMNELKNRKIDLNTPQSILCDYNWTQLLNRKNFDRLPAYYQYHLTKLLPKCDQQLLDNNVICPTETAFTNEFFSRAVNNYFNRLVEGKLTTESLAKIKREIEKTKNRLDPLKLKYFEPVFRTPEEDLPKPLTDDDRCKQGMAFMNAFINCVDKVKQTQRKKQRLMAASATTQQQQPSTSANISQLPAPQSQPPPPSVQQHSSKKRIWDYLPSLTTYEDPRVKKMVNETSMKPKATVTFSDVEKNPDLLPYLDHSDLDRYVQRKISSLISQLSLDKDPRRCYRSCDSPPALPPLQPLTTTIELVRRYNPSDDRFSHIKPGDDQFSHLNPVYSSNNNNNNDVYDDDMILDSECKNIVDDNIIKDPSCCDLEIEQLNLDEQIKFDQLLMISDLKISEAKHRHHPQQSQSKSQITTVPKKRKLSKKNVITPQSTLLQPVVFANNDNTGEQPAFFMTTTGNMLTMIPNDKTIIKQPRQGKPKATVSDINLLNNPSSTTNTSLTQANNQSTSKACLHKPTPNNSSPLSMPIKYIATRTHYPISSTSTSIISGNCGQNMQQQQQQQHLQSQLNLNRATTTTTSDYSPGGGAGTGESTSSSKSSSPLKVQPIHVIFDNNNESLPKIVLTPPPSSSSSLSPVSNRPIAVNSTISNTTSGPVQHQYLDNNGKVHFKYYKKPPTTIRRIESDMLKIGNYRMIELPQVSSSPSSSPVSNRPIAVNSTISDTTSCSVQHHQNESGKVHIKYNKKQPTAIRRIESDLLKVGNYRMIELPPLPSSMLTNQTATTTTKFCTFQPLPLQTSIIAQPQQQQQQQSLNRSKCTMTIQRPTTTKSSTVINSIHDYQSSQSIVHHHQMATINPSSTLISSGLMPPPPPPPQYSSTITNTTPKRIRLMNTPFTTVTTLPTVVHTNKSSNSISTELPSSSRKIFDIGQAKTFYIQTPTSSSSFLKTNNNNGQNDIFHKQEQLGTRFDKMSEEQKSKSFSPLPEDKFSGHFQKKSNNIMCSEQRATIE